MNRYLNEKCPVCFLEFHEKDEVTVCPECGTPHHKDCYFKSGICSNIALHDEEWSWEFLSDTAADDFSSCEEIPGYFDKDTKTIGEMANKIPEFSFLLNPYGGIDPEKKIYDIKVKEIAIYIGRNSHYYIPIFKRMSESNSIISLNLSAGILAPFQQLYRRMYSFGVIILLLTFILNIPYLLKNYIFYMFPELANLFPINMEDLEQFIYSMSTASFALTLLLMLFTNRLYMAHVIKDIKYIKSMFDYEESYEYYNCLAEKGHPSFKSMFMVYLGVNSAILFVICFLVMFFIK